LISPLGWLPAENARNLPFPSRFRIASAMIERAELPVQRNSTLKVRSELLMVRGQLRGGEGVYATQ
jgi:hypothetical protein